MRKQKICIDFDGVIHPYRTKWQGEDIIPDPAEPEMVTFLEGLRKEYQVIVWSSRARTEKGVDAIKKWLSENHIEVDGITRDKIPALLYIDDRAIRFNGKTEGLMEEIRNFKPWNR